MNKGLLIHELCEKLEITPKAVRYYEQAGIIPAASRNSANYRVYTNKDLKRLDFIKKARAMDFSLEEIKSIISIKEEGNYPCNKVISLMEVKLSEIDKRIEEMIEFKKLLSKSLENFKGHYEEGKKGEVCGFIENIF